METKNQQKKQRVQRKFTDEFKASAVRLVIEEGKSVAAVARDLDLVESALASWVKRAKEAGSAVAGATSPSEKLELVRLRSENRILRMEREILKNHRRGPHLWARNCRAW